MFIPMNTNFLFLFMPICFCNIKNVRSINKISLYYANEPTKKKQKGTTIFKNILLFMRKKRRKNYAESSIDLSRTIHLVVLEI